MADTDGRNPENYSFKNKKFDQLDESEKFTKYGTSAVEKCASGIRLIEQHGIKGALEKASKGEREYSNFDLKDIKDRAKEIAKKLMMDVKLSEDEKVFLVEHEEEMNEVLR